ncbi:uncharacterized protein BXIN_0396 [Babesia sp. Xinjiang]|uniref:uncharacterized protein n=1 Tax=Babesia sp. Xinjiang TaxID=462227 RepID=UPI000A24D6F1|nr:uncharacterized protein BXIN_0396 [Babesia sp. Xinjiang]ORM41050.1 hypothetical protein BXIN_0396 [Babesia sp. Xinjiang]
MVGYKFSKFVIAFLAFVQIIAVDDVLGADLTQQKELKGRMPTPCGFDELTDQLRDTLPDDIATEVAKHLASDGTAPLPEDLERSVSLHLNRKLFSEIPRKISKAFCLPPQNSKLPLEHLDHILEHLAKSYEKNNVDGRIRKLFNDTVNRYGRGMIGPVDWEDAKRHLRERMGLPSLDSPVMNASIKTDIEGDDDDAPTIPGDDELADDGDFEDQELCLEGDEKASSEEEAEEIEPASHSKPSAVSMEIKIGEAYKPQKSCLSSGEIEIDDSVIKLGKERFKHILRRLTEFYSEQVLYKPYVKMVQGMKNRRSIVLPINIAVKLANVKPGMLPEQLIRHLCRYLSEVLLKEHRADLPEADRSRKDYIIRSNLWNYVYKALTCPWWVGTE